MNRKIAIEAVAFYKVGNELFNRYLEKVNNHEKMEDIDYMVMWPVIVNLAFSCELFLKSMLSEKKLNKAKRNKNGHDLKYLFRIQDVSTKRYIKTKIFSKYGVDEIWFNTKLSETSNAFNRWRYYYEKEKGVITASISVLQYMAEVLLEKYNEEFDL